MNPLKTHLSGAICLTAFIAIGCVMLRPAASLANTYCAGAYISTEAGGYTWSVSRSSTYIFVTRTPPSMSTAVMAGGGLVWTGEFLDGRFMLRQNLGLEAFIAKRFDIARFSLVNTFSYVPFRTDDFFVWFGPQLNLFYIWGKDSSSSMFLYSDFIATNVPVYRKRRYRILPIGTGLALGVDYEVYPNLRLSFEGGFHLSTSVYGSSHEVGDGKASATGYEGYATVGVLYRFTEKSRNMQDDE
ncbi:MAG TPA: hypothetical protein PLM53_13665 [Spirochaetota bacterium]|nr:hypothetical protein [Spirochaetota bacterium]HQF09458.1 hypothetical protein [Spirochaetota bacterium]HQH98141.1 hypothetical protein [Spirochaetota bacterium]HQJ72913.1 hypothetical protein [Spirochaetota bacterium]HRS75510.1 hypothetical protein [Spirochaetota bacterium]